MRDYTHVYHGKVGFQVEVDQQLITELNINDLPEWEKHIGIVFDEMKIKDGIVFDKHNFEILGYVNLGEVTNQLLEFEALCSEVSSETHLPEVAKYINCFMVRSIFQPFNFPYAQFSTAGITSDQLFPLVWEAVKRLELIGLKVVFITCDGASPNRRFFQMHCKKKNDIVYKTIVKMDGLFTFLSMFLIS